VELKKSGGEKPELPGTKNALSFFQFCSTFNKGIKTDIIFFQFHWSQRKTHYIFLSLALPFLKVEKTHYIFFSLALPFF